MKLYMISTNKSSIEKEDIQQVQEKFKKLFSKKHIEIYTDKTKRLMM